MLNQCVGAYSMAIEIIIDVEICMYVYIYVKTDVYQDSILIKFKQ